jgi:hypothetical protein
MIGGRPISRLLITAVSLAGVACQLPRPDTTPVRTIEPELVEPARQAPSSTSVPIRLLETQARGHIGRHVLHRQADGELVEDGVWRWSSTPDRYLDTALRLELSSSSTVRLVDASSAPALAATLLEWHLESAPENKLVGAIELRFIGADRGVNTQVLRASEAVSGELPGNLAAAAGRLLHHLATEAVTSIARKSGSG